MGRLVSVLVTVAAVVAAFAMVAAGGVGVARAGDVPASTVVAWGRNGHGQRDVPVGLTGVVQVAAGTYHSLALKSDGTVVGWGDNRYGETTVPKGLSGVTQVAAGDDDSLALQADGTVVGWGFNEYGQASPPAGLTGVVQVAAGDAHSLALKADGTVVAWGANGAGQATVPAGLTGVTQVAAGYEHSLALKADGTVVAWGDSYHGETSVPSGLSDVVQIAAGFNVSMALKADGTVVAWGDATPPVPAGLTGVTQVAAGAEQFLALKNDGTVVAWGSNNATGQLGDVSGLNGVTQIAIGGSHSLALVVDRAVVGFQRSGYAAAENAGTVPVMVTGTNLTDHEVQVTDARTGGSAAPGADFRLPIRTFSFLPGQTTTYTLPVTIIDDNIPESAETITIALHGVIPGASIRPPATITLTIEASDQQPDLLISNTLKGGYIGDDIYNTTGAGQTQTRTAPHHGIRLFFVRLTNDGNTFDNFTLKARADSALTVQYYWHYYAWKDGYWVWIDITRPLLTGNGWPFPLQVGGHMTMKVRITVTRSARIGTTRSANVTASWTGDRTNTDLVKARVRVTR